MTNIVNKRPHNRTPNDVYIGRGSIWGNPFIIGKDGTREEVIEKYKELMHRNLGNVGAEEWLYKILQLDGKNLVCYCKPQACHGDVLVEIIEELME